MKTIFIVSDMPWYDFGIKEQRIFSSKEKAEKWISSQEYPDSYNIYQFEIDKDEDRELT